jgi:RNA polymerase sigma factor (sigma-70 family)
LRKPEALPKWIMHVTSHKCLRRKGEQGRVESTDADDSNHKHDSGADPHPNAEAILREAEREQVLRDAIAELQPRCRQLVQMLFFEEDALEYREIAQRLEIATGSIGFIRQRCLEKLRRRLDEKGF